MDPSIRLGLELPPLDPPAGSDHAPVTLGRLLDTVAAAERAGFGAVWVTGGAADNGCDGCTLAAGLASGAPSVTLGVVASLDGARNPSLLARDVTALDIVSGGRSALLLGGGHCLGEAIAVCRTLFSGAGDFDGDCYRLSGAVNRPAPVRPDGPPLWAQPAEPGALATLVGMVDAFVVEGTPSDLEAVCRTAEVATAGVGRPAVVWRGGLGEGPGAAGVADQVELLHRSGADGLILRPEGEVGWPTDDFDTRIERLGALLGPVVEGWRR